MREVTLKGTPPERHAPGRSATPASQSRPITFSRSTPCMVVGFQEFDLTHTIVLENSLKAGWPDYSWGFAGTFLTRMPRLDLFDAFDNNAMGFPQSLPHTPYGVWQAWVSTFLPHAPYGVFTCLPHKPHGAPAKPGTFRGCPGWRCSTPSYPHCARPVP